MWKGVARTMVSLAVAGLLLMQYAPLAWLAVAPVCDHCNGSFCPRTRPCPHHQDPAHAATDAHHHASVDHGHQDPISDAGHHAAEDGASLCACHGEVLPSVAFVPALDKVIVASRPAEASALRRAAFHAVLVTVPSPLLPDDIFHPPRPVV